MIVFCVPKKFDRFFTEIIGSFEAKSNNVKKFTYDDENTEDLYRIIHNNTVIFVQFIPPFVIKKYGKKRFAIYNTEQTTRKNCSVGTFLVASHVFTQPQTLVRHSWSSGVSGGGWNLKPGTFFSHIYIPPLTAIT